MTAGDPQHVPDFADSRLVTRRSAIALGAGVAGTVALTALPAWARVRGPTHLRPHRPRPDELPYPDRPMGEPGIPQIENVVLVMLENHSADNVLGMLPHAVPARRRDFDGLPVNRFGAPIASNPSNAQTAPRPVSGYVRSYPAPDDCASSGLTQNWNSSHAQYNGGRNDGFVTNAESPTPMMYLTQEQLPVTYALAGHFPVNDRYFCSLLGQTLPNRRYYLSGTSSGQVNDDDSSAFVPAANGTIFDRLDAGGVSWAVYYGSAPTPLVYFPNFRDNPAQVARCLRNDLFFTAASAGTLPAVSYVEENFNYQSEENPQDVAYGEGFLRQVVQACMDSPQWDKLALFVTYDEHGGYYDHVPPPAAIAPDDIAPDLTLSAKGTFPAKFDRYGFRVPMMVISPWGQPRYVSHKVADHTSILAFLEHKWNLPPLTRRDAAAWDLRDMFDVTERRLADPPSLPAAPDIPSSLQTCRADGENPPTASIPNQLPTTVTIPGVSGMTLPPLS